VAWICSAPWPDFNPPFTAFDEDRACNRKDHGPDRPPGIPGPFVDGDRACKRPVILLVSGSRRRPKWAGWAGEPDGELA